MKNATPKQPKYRLEVREGPAHGGLYELEQDFYTDVVENKTNRVVMTFESEGYTTFQGGGDWGEFEMSGVEKVELSPNEKMLVVYTYGSNKPKKIPLPN